MEFYITKNDNNVLKITIILNSDAKPDDPNEVYVTIYNENNARSYRKIPVVRVGPDKYLTIVEKNMLKERPIIKIKSFFIVDAVQLPDKDRVVAHTNITYTFNEIPNVEFRSVYENNKDEYVKGKPSDETFNVTKRILVKFQ